MIVNIHFGFGDGQKDQQRLMLSFVNPLTPPLSLSLPLSPPLSLSLSLSLSIYIYIYITGIDIQVQNVHSGLYMAG